MVDIGSSASETLLVELRKVTEGGIPRSILMEGPAGTGKSTLGDAYCRDADRLGCVVVKADRETFLEVASSFDRCRGGKLMVVFVDEVEELSECNQMILADLVRKSEVNRMTFLASCNFPSLLHWDLQSAMHHLRVDVPPGIRVSMGLPDGRDTDLREVLKRIHQPRSISELSDISDAEVSRLIDIALEARSGTGWSPEEELDWALSASRSACPPSRFFDAMSKDKRFDPYLAPSMSWGILECEKGADPWLAFMFVACALRNTS